MRNEVITAAAVWKQYRYGSLSAGTLKEDVERWWRMHILKQEDPYQPEPENTETFSRTSGYFWALKEINFQVQKGEVLGLVGKNGAGKSTLLKILSRVTKPTKGTIKGSGRIASLLEVGTGFHDDLTGRENIFLNGNILGMTNREIRERFDQIVAFSGVEKFIDTPVKRYSSGMFVRLAFAVAAHLNPEILIVDEVLSVGDAEFQRRCLGKMHDISENQGSTVIFVSHNMQAIQNLCTRALLIEGGQIRAEGKPVQIINTYSRLTGRKHFSQEWPDTADAPGNQQIRIRKVSLEPEQHSKNEVLDIRTPLRVRFSFSISGREFNLCVGVHLFTEAGDCIFDVSSVPGNITPGQYSGECLIPGNFLNDGAYFISLIFVQDTSRPLYYFENCLSFELEDYRENFSWYGKWIGSVRPNFPVTIKAVEL